MRNFVCLSISAILLSATSVSSAAIPDSGLLDSGLLDSGLLDGGLGGLLDAGADGSVVDSGASDAASANDSGTSGDDSGTTTGDDDSGTTDGGDTCTAASASCGALTAGQACTIAASGSIGVCTLAPCSGSTVLQCEPALGGLLDAGTDASTTTITTNNTCAPHAAECAGHKLGDGCDTGDGPSGNCGEVTCGGVTTLTCIDGKGSTDGGCMVGSPDDAASIFGLFAVLAPFAAIRRRKSKKTSK